MSFTAVGDLTLYGNSGTSGVFTFTGAAIPAGSLVVIGWDANVDSLTVTASDNSTQPGDPNVWLSAGTMSGGTFTAGVHYCLRITRPLLTTDTLTLTLGGAVTASRRSAAGCIYTPSNGNAQLDKYQQVANDTTSPVGPTASTGTLSTAVDLAITFGFVKNGAVATGSSNASTNMNSPGTHVEANSGGITTIVATRMADSNQAATTAMTGSWTYTGITVGACAIMAFMDVLQTWSPDTGRDRASSSDNPENYAPPPSQTMGIFSGNGAAAPDATAFVAASRANGFGRGAYSSVSGAADEPIPSASGWFQAAQRPREQPLYEPLESFVVPVYDQAAAGPPDYSPGVILRRQTLSYIPPRSLSLLVAAPDAYAPTVARRQNGQSAAVPRSSSIPAYDSPAAAPDSWAQVLSSRMSPRNGSPKSSTIAAYVSVGVAPDVWIQGLASRIVVPYMGSFSAFMGAVDEPIAAGSGWAAFARSLRSARLDPPRSTVIASADEPIDSWAAFARSPRVARGDSLRSVVIASADEPIDSWAALALSRTLPRQPPPRSLVVPVYFAAVATGPGSAPTAVSVRAALYDAPGSMTIAVADEAIGEWTEVTASRAPLLALMSRSQTIAAFTSPAVDQAVLVTRSLVRAAALAGRSIAVTATPSVTLDAYVPLARSSGSLEQVARRSLTIVPREVPVVITQAYVAPTQSRAVANYKAPSSRSITGLSPSPADQVVNSGGGGEWVIWGKPDFPGNRPGAWPRFPRPGFKRPSRYEKRGY